MFFFNKLFTIRIEKELIKNSNYFYSSLMPPSQLITQLVVIATGLLMCLFQAAKHTKYTNTNSYIQELYNIYDVGIK